MPDRKPLLIALIAIVVLAAVFYFTYNSDKPKYDWRDAWVEHAYKETSTEPYGSQIAHRLLERYFLGKKLTDIQKSIVKELPLDSSKGANYVFIGEAMYMDSVSTQHLLQFVRSGNTAFLASKTIPFDLMFSLYYEECPEAEWSDYSSLSSTEISMTLREPRDLTPKRTDFHFAAQNKPVSYDWHYIAEIYFCNSLPQQPLGYLRDTFVNFAKFPYGKGQFLLHTNPLVFTNYSLLRTETRPYVEGVLSWLPSGNIYWDAMSRVPEAVARRRNQNRGGGPSGGLENEHPLTYILQQPSLAWAWYLLAGLAGAWLIFRAKRRQRIIPVLPKNENSSYEFISTVANLHFREKNYQGLCIQRMRLFLAAVRERYGLVASLEAETFYLRADEAYLRRLATVSEVPEQHIHDIFAQYTATVQFQPTEQMMVNLHLAIEQFFKKAK